MFCEPCKANSTIPARRVGRQRSSQRLHRGSAPTLGARFSEKLGRLRAKLFSKSDPYLGAFQEAEVFRNPAASTDTGHFGKLGQGPCDETTYQCALPRRTASALGLFALHIADAAQAGSPARDRTYSHEQAAEDNAPRSVIAAASAQPMIHSLDTLTCH